MAIKKISGAPAQGTEYIQAVPYLQIQEVYSKDQDQDYTTAQSILLYDGTFTKKEVRK